MKKLIFTISLLFTIIAANCQKYVDTYSAFGLGHRSQETGWDWKVNPALKTIRIGVFYNGAATLDKSIYKVSILSDGKVVAVFDLPYVGQYTYNKEGIEFDGTDSGGLSCKVELVRKSDYFEIYLRYNDVEFMYQFKDKVYRVDL